MEEKCGSQRLCNRWQVKDGSRCWRNFVPASGHLKKRRTSPGSRKVTGLSAKGHMLDTNSEETSCPGVEESQLEIEKAVSKGVRVLAERVVHSLSLNQVLFGGRALGI